MTAPPGLQALRLATFDLYQRLDPRECRSAPAVIVAIDEASIAARGQWPWPRSTVADLIDKITAARPAAIGVDIIFPEPDRISPERLAGQLAEADPALAKRLEALPGWRKVSRDPVLRSGSLDWSKVHHRLPMRQ